MTDCRKKPVIVQAIQWTGQNAEQLRKFVGLVPYSDFLCGFDTHGSLTELWVEKSDAWCNMITGDWVIKEPDGSGFYPCAYSVFEKTYDEVEAK